MLLMFVLLLHVFINNLNNNNKPKQNFKEEEFC